MHGRPCKCNALKAPLMEPRYSSANYRWLTLIPCFTCSQMYLVSPQKAFQTFSSI